MGTYWQRDWRRRTFEDDDYFPTSTPPGSSENKVLVSCEISDTKQNHMTSITENSSAGSTTASTM